MTWGWLALGIALVAAVFAAYRLGGLTLARTYRELEQVRHELARRLNELFSLQELSYVLSDSLKLDRIVTQVVRYVTRFLGADGAMVVLAQEGDEKVRVAAAEGMLAPLAGTSVPRALIGLAGLVIDREQMEVLESGPGTPAMDVAGIPVQRIAVAPLRAHGVTVGSLAVVNRAVGPFTAEDLRLLSTVATHAAVVLANARFFDQIRAGKEQWETTFDALADGVVVVDQAGDIRRANKSFGDLVDIPVQSLSGTGFTEALRVVTPELTALLQAVRGGEPSAAILVQAPADAPPRTRNRVLRIAASPMRGAQEAGWVVVLIEDVTEQKAFETRLIQNEKMVAVGQLVSGVAHELNNPLTSITGLSEFLLEQGTSSERDTGHLNVIREQAERAGRIVRNLLTFARKGAGDYEDVDLNDIAQRTAQLIEYDVRMRAVALETRLAPDLPPVRGDRFELQQVVLNLITNAVHSVAQNQEGEERRVVVSTSRSDDAVVLRVADTGRGIPPEHVANLFTPFFTTKDPGQGTGLGLSISFGIVERHGGLLSVEPSTSGASFLMSLPVGPAQRSAGSTTAPQADDASSSLEPRSILLVDDDPAVQRAIRALFSREGQTVSAPPTARDAVRLLEASRYELIIADARAAVSPGEMFADALLRRWPEHKSRTILLTADVRPETHDWLRSTGCHYFQKPFKVSELRSTVRRVMEHGGHAPKRMGAC